MEILQDYSYQELTKIILDLGEKSYRAGQIYRALSNGLKISEITEISKTLREKLLAKYYDEPVKLYKKFVSVDGTEKYLFSLYDGNVVEGVYMKNNYGNTQCLSTQIGCKMGCVFCASGIGGLVRNLSSGEMFATTCLVNRLGGGNVNKRAVTNIVLMGSGEPFDNYDNTIKYLRCISSKEGLNVSLRNISLSTSGLVPQIYKFSEENLPLNLTISLHNPFTSERAKLMPITKAYSVEEILKACEHYFNKTGRRYIFEYSLVKGENDSKKCADELVRILKGRPCHVNIIRLNEVKENSLKCTTEKETYAFCGYLEKNGLSATVRRLNGADIEGACGQLRRSVINNQNNN